MNILIAEDDAVSRRLLRGHLERWGHHVTEAVDGAEAWDLFQRGEPGPAGADASSPRGQGFPIVVVDWMMPGVDGLELIRRIRGRQLPRYVYLLMLTAKNQKQDIVTGMDAGADDYLTKPFDKEELRARLQAGQRIIELQAALLLSEKSASVGRLAVGVAAEISAPIAEVLQTMIELRQDTLSVIESLAPSGGSDDAAYPAAGPVPSNISAHDPDAPPRPPSRPLDIPALRGALGPRFVTAEAKLHRVRELARSLRDFARLDDLPTRPLQLPTLVTETLSMMRQELASKNLSVLWEPRTDIPLVSGNAGKLKRAIYNLLCFLSESSPPGGQLHLTLTRNPAASPVPGVTLELKGPTPTLTPESAGNLFEPFSRFGTKSPTPGPSSGLGLPIAFSILREHAATLEASSTAGQTIFTLRLPTA